jgi:hypothetical protein
MSTSTSTLALTVSCRLSAVGCRLSAVRGQLSGRGRRVQLCWSGSGTCESLCAQPQALRGCRETSVSQSSAERGTDGELAIDELDAELAKTATDGCGE